MLATARHGDLTLAIALAEEAGRPHAWFGLGSRLPGPLRLAVVRGDEQTDLLLHGRAPRWGAGFTLPGLRTIIIRADAGDPWGTLRHELAHLALHDVAKVRVPLWFDEGYAAVAAGEWSRLVALGLNLGVARGAVPGFFELDRALRSNQPTASTGSRRVKGSRRRSSPPPGGRSGGSRWSGSGRCAIATDCSCG